jgi:NET1-associated nuclear protein 1 (U3 small nucleolar RNA-associated protein 17)
MAPSKDSPTLAESLKKRKLDRTDLQNEERLNRKKQKSKRKSLGEQNGEQTGTPAAQSNAGSNSRNQDYIAPQGQLVVKEASIGQLEVANSSWNVSKPIGGRMLDIDPIFAEDEV